MEGSGGDGDGRRRPRSPLSLLVAAVVVAPLPPCRRWQAAAVTRPQLMVHLPPLCRYVGPGVVNGGNVSGAAAVANGSKQWWGGGQVVLRRTAARGDF